MEEGEILLNSNLVENMEIVDSFCSTAETAANTYTKDIEVGQIAILTIGYAFSDDRIVVSDENAVIYRQTAKAIQASGLPQYAYWHTMVVVKPTKDTGTVTITAPWGSYWTALSCVVLG